MRRTGLLSLVISLALLVWAAGCSSAEASRTYIYGSLDELMGDTSVLVEGQVMGAAPEITNGLSSTLVTVLVQRQFFPKRLGTAPIAHPINDTPRVGEIVRVRRQSMMNVPLETGRRYLLFLIDTGLDQDPADIFYVVGIDAGVYAATSAGFRRLGQDPDTIPEVISESDLNG